MIRHVVMFRWRRDFPAERRDAWMAGVRALPARIPQIRQLTVGSDELSSGRSWDAAIVCDFASLEDLAIYASHPDHLPLIELSGKGAEEIASVDFDLTPRQES